MNFRRHLWIAALCLPACACSPKPAPPNGGPVVAPLPEPEAAAVQLDGTAVPVRLLTAEPARSQGPAGLTRESAAGVVLLRVYPRPLYVAVTNRRYRVHTELAWIDAAGKVLRVDHLRPDEGLKEDDRKYWKSPGRVQYALEALEGELQQRGVVAGATLTLRDGLAREAAELPVPPRSTLTLTVGGRTVTAEIAATVPHRRHGLMFRNALPKDHGMLFIYPGAKERGFWMKNCAMDIDIAYTTADGTIVSIHTMTAAWHSPDNADLPGYPSGGKCAMALEMEAGWFARHGVKAGDTLGLPGHITTLQRTADK
ncbi:MAG: DUF192 domain-containing protein [Planctomycetota bacterium]|jgi:uncharacterized membrane protein (UPF0127 family)